MKHPRVKITEGVRDDCLSTPLVPSVTCDPPIPGFALIATRRAAHWCLFFQPPGRRPDGRRWGGGARATSGDAFLTPVREARTAALAAKQVIREGRDPLKGQQAGAPPLKASALSRRRSHAMGSRSTTKPSGRAPSRS